MKKLKLPINFALLGLFTGEILILGALIFVSIFVNPTEASWPPQKGEVFPNVEFIDQKGNKTFMSEFKGDVVLVEYVGMNCPACQAFSGGNDPAIGPYQNNALQKGLPSIEKLLPKYSGGVGLSDKRITYVAILLYDMSLKDTNSDEAAQWAKHFRFNREEKEVVLVPVKDLRGNASFNLIPGFCVLDKNLVVRSESAGHHPKENLYTETLPMVGRLINE